MLGLVTLGVAGPKKQEKDQGGAQTSQSDTGKQKG
jgi:hypothetical protein